MKRCNQVIALLTDSELSSLQSLQKSYSSSGLLITKSFLIRYGLSRLPLESPFLVLR